MANRIRPGRRRTRRKPADKPATVEELRALHQSAVWQTMVARVRQAELERAERHRYPLRPTVIKVMRDLTERVYQQSHV